MTDNNHPITPPPELVQQWCKQLACINEPGPIHLWLATEAARWGADQQLKLDIEQVNQAWQRGADHELEACCEWLIAHYWKAASEQLRATRRPKPPSLKERALALISHDPENQPFLSEKGIAIIRRALESLPD